MFGEIELTRTSWHWKLQMFVLKRVPFQDNFCPYFWISIFCLLVSPFVVLWKSLVFAVLSPFLTVLTFVAKGFDTFCDAILALFDTLICSPLYNWSLHSASDTQVENLWAHSKERHKKDWEAKEKSQYESGLKYWEKRGKQLQEALESAKASGNPEEIKEAEKDLLRHSTNKPYLPEWEEYRWYENHVGSYSSAKYRVRVGDRIKKQDRKFQDWKEAHPDWEERLQAAIKAIEERRELRRQEEAKRFQQEFEREKKARARREAMEAVLEKQKLKLLKVSKVVVPVFVIAFFLVVLYALFLGIKFVYDWGNWHTWYINSVEFITSSWILLLESWTSVALVAGIVVGSLFGIALVTVITPKLMQKCNLVIPGPVVSAGKGSLGFLARRVSSIERFLNGIGLGFKNFFSFLFLFIKSWKENHCPSIKWTE